MIFRQLFDKESSTYTYLLADPSSREAALIDPVVEHVERDLKLVAELGCRLTKVLDTHVHADHVTAAGTLRQRTGAKTHFSAHGGPACADVLLSDGDEVELGALRIRALETPGHTNTCMSYVVDGKVFTGDALLIRGCGRTDFQEGDAATLWRSVREKLFALPDDTYVYPAHDYRGQTRSTIAEERKHNPRLGEGMTEAQFVELMNNLGLPPPAKIHEAVPANKACGQR
ncbi:MAG: MBL fold metallo-hydrolase [Labilithrix sp.]|nr:MBL fold metallo-hydrolase [Labilithrix sp.]